MSARADTPGLTRGQLLAAAAAGGAALVTAPLVAALATAGGGDAAAPRPAAATPAHLRRGAWSGLVGATVNARGPGGIPARLRLDAVDDVRTPALAGADDAFVVRFAPLDGPAPDDGLRALDHPRLGAVELWLGAVGPHGPARRLEAVVFAGAVPGTGRA